MKKKQHIKEAESTNKKVAAAIRADAPIGPMIGPIPKALVIAVILIAGLLIYTNSFHGDFVYDDEEHVLNNTAIRSFRNIPAVFTHNLTYFGGEKEGKFYRPLETLSFMVDYAVGGLKPFGYHMTNTLLHVLVCVLLFYFLWCILKDTAIAGIASLLYLVHPVHTEAVAYISGRADSISSIFLLLMVIFQYRLWSSNGYKRVLYYALILFCFMLALLTKESAVVFPFLLIFFEYCVRSREGYSRITGRRLLFYLPLIAVVGIWLFVKNKIVSTEAMVIMQTSLASRLAALPRVICNYVRIVFVPVNLHMEYRYPFTTTVFAPGYLGPFILILPLVPFLYYVWKKSSADINFRIMFFGLGWFFMALLPYLNIFFQLNAIFSEHWLYIPGMGLALFLVYAVFYLTRGRKQAQALAVALFMCAAAIFSVVTVRQNAVWKNNIAFFEYTIKHAPYSAKTYNNLAVEYIKKKDFERALPLLEKAVALDPEYGVASENLRRLRADINEE